MTHRFGVVCHVCGCVLEFVHWYVCVCAYQGLVYVLVCVCISLWLHLLCTYMYYVNVFVYIHTWHSYMYNVHVYVCKGMPQHIPSIHVCVYKFIKLYIKVYNCFGMFILFLIISQ